MTTDTEERERLRRALKTNHVTRQQGGINWDWAFFSTQSDANAFDAWCGANGYETRGVYPPDHISNDWGVRYR